MDYFHVMGDTNIDKLVYFYNSSIQDPAALEKHAIINYLTKFVSEKMALHNLLIASYDIGKIRVHEDFFFENDFGVHNVYFAPASQTRGPYVRFEEKFEIEEIIIFILTHAEFKYDPKNILNFSSEDDVFFKNKELLFREAEQEDFLEQAENDL